MLNIGALTDLSKVTFKNQYEEGFPVEFQYLLWICSNISESSLKTQLFEIFNIHMDKYLLPFEISFLQLLVKKYLVGGGEQKKEES